MKSYTDLEQSKRLAEILPIESADGYWIKHWPCQPYMVCTAGTVNPDKHIPCWSLAALLEIINRNYYTTLYHDGVAWNIDVIYHDNNNKHNAHSNYPIDACYEMILKLHEQKIL